MKTFLTTMNMCLSKMLVLLVIFGAISCDNSQVMAFSSTRNPSPPIFTTIQPSRSNEGSQYGKHFVIGFTEQHPFRQTSGFLQISIVAIFDTTVTIRAATSNNILFNSFVKAGQVIEYKPPVSLRMNGTNIERKGIEVNSTKDVAIICLNHVRGTADAYLALPTDALGTVYVVASYKRSNIGIISGNDGTKICITLNTNGAVVYRGISYYRGSSLCVNLQKLEAFHIKHSYDLSGTIIAANKPISVISGDTCTVIGPGFCDHVAAFLLPVRNWGKEFILASTGTMNRNTGDVSRIFAYETNTVVRSAYGEDVLSSGEFKEIDLTVDLASSINCSKPCQVIQYTRGKHINGKYADPSIIVLPSVGQFLSYYHVVLPGGSAYGSDSVTLFIEESYKNGLLMNGSQITGLQWQRINGTEHTWAVLNVSGYDIVNIYHSSREIRFGLLVFGWEGYVSYGYPGGFALTDVNPASSPIFTTIKPSRSSTSKARSSMTMIGFVAVSVVLLTCSRSCWCSHMC